MLRDALVATLALFLLLAVIVFIESMSTGRRERREIEDWYRRPTFDPDDDYDDGSDPWEEEPRGGRFDRPDG